jgi:hypothetical protein
MQKINLLRVMSEPNGGVRALTELPDNLVLAILEDITEYERMIPTWAIILHPLRG